MNHQEIRFRLLFILYDFYYQGKRQLQPEEIFKESGLDKLNKDYIQGDLEYLGKKGFIEYNIEPLSDITIIWHVNISGYGIDIVEKITDKSIEDLTNAEIDQKSIREVIEIKNEEDEPTKIKKLYNFALRHEGTICSIIEKVVIAFLQN